MSAAETFDDRPATRDQRRSKRKRAVRASTISIKRMSKREVEMGRLMFPDDESHERPKTRAECGGVQRPCVFVGCKYNLYLDVNPRTGAIKVNFPDIEPCEMKESCALDVAERGGATREEVGEYKNFTRERVRQIEVIAFTKIASVANPKLRELYSLDEEIQPEQLKTKPRIRLSVLKP